MLLFEAIRIWIVCNDKIRTAEDYCEDSISHHAQLS